MAGLREKPLMGALIIGGVAALLVGAVVVFGSGGGGSNGTAPAKEAQGPDLPPAQGNVLLTPQGTATPFPTQPPAATATPAPPTNTPEPPTPQPVQVTQIPIPATPIPPTATPQPPAPTATPQPPAPTATPQPPAPTATPQPPAPTATPQGGGVPAAKTSSQVSITFNPGGHGSVHHLNEQLTLSYRGPANQAIAVYDVAAPNTKIFQGNATGSEIGVPVVLGGAPNRVLTMRIDLLNNGQVSDFATVSIQVVN